MNGGGVGCKTAELSVMGLNIREMCLGDKEPKKTALERGLFRFYLFILLMQQAVREWPGERGPVAEHESAGEWLHICWTQTG